MVCPLSLVALAALTLGSTPFAQPHTSTISTPNSTSPVVFNDNGIYDGDNYVEIMPINANGTSSDTVLTPIREGPAGLSKRDIRAALELQSAETFLWGHVGKKSNRYRSRVV